MKILGFLGTVLTGILFLLIGGTWMWSAKSADAAFQGMVILGLGSLILNTTKPLEERP